MRRMLASTMSLALGLAVCAGAWAQQDGNNRGKGDPPSGGKQTIRGVVAGITLIGETVINFETKQAEAARASYLTILGSPTNGDQDRDQNHNNARNTADVHRGDRDNVYIVAITPNTAVRMANDSGHANTNNQQAFENLEVGDKVEVTFTPSDVDRNRRQASDQRHGRNRTFHGDAASIKILSMPSDRDQSNDRDKDKDKDRDRDRSSSSADKDRQ